MGARRAGVASLVAACALAGAPGSPADVAAQDGSRPVALRLVPRAGDTLRMRFEQDVAMTGPARRPGGGDTTVTRRSAMLVLSRSIVEHVGRGGATVAAVTDSVALRADGADPAALDAARRAMAGRRTRLRMTPTGASELLPADGAPTADGAPHASFPATLPAEPVAVGATWTREMPLPGGETGGGRGGDGKVAVVFRLDSVVGGALAYLTLRGELSRTTRPDARGARAVTRGRLVGSVLVDLRRGWVTDARTGFVMTTVVTRAGAPPARMKLRVTQRLRAM